MGKTTRQPRVPRHDDHTSTTPRTARADALPADGGASDSPTDRLAALLDQFAGESGFRVYLERLDDAGAPEYLGVVPFDEQLYDRVRDAFGGGQYGGRIVDANRKYKGRVPRFRIAGKQRDATAPTGSADDSPLLGELRALRQAIEQQRTAPATGADPVAQVVAIAKALREVAAPAAAQPAPSPFDAKSLIETVEGVLALRDRIADDAPARGNGGGVAAAIDKAVPVLGRMLDMVAESRRGHTNVASGAGVDTVTLPATTAPPAAGAGDVVGWLRPFMRYKGLLIEVADKGKNAGQYADLVMDAIEDNQGLLVALVHSERAGTLDDDFARAVPELSTTPKRQEFAAAFLASIRESLQEMTIDDGEGAGEGGAP